MLATYPKSPKHTLVEQNIELQAQKAVALQEVERLTDRVEELEGILCTKDDRIEELEAKVAELQEQVDNTYLDEADPAFQDFKRQVYEDKDKDIDNLIAKVAEQDKLIFRLRGNASVHIRHENEQLRSKVTELEQQAAEIRQQWLARGVTESAERIEPDQERLQHEHPESPDLAPVYGGSDPPAPEPVTEEEDKAHIPDEPVKTAPKIKALNAALRELGYPGHWERDKHGPYTYHWNIDGYKRKITRGYEDIIDCLRDGYIKLDKSQHWNEKYQQLEQPVPEPDYQELYEELLGENAALKDQLADRDRQIEELKAKLAQFEQETTAYAG
jgi:predicted RNase H-like nuclease (RuvC/YqgF family)